MSKSNIRLEKSGGNSYDILSDNDIIGFIEETECHLQKIEIKKQYRNKGYGTKALKLWIKQKKDECEKIETTSIVSYNMERILKKLNFERKEENPSHFIKYL